MILLYIFILPVVMFMLCSMYSSREASNISKIIHKQQNLLKDATMILALTKKKSTSSVHLQAIDDMEDILQARG